MHTAYRPQPLHHHRPLTEGPRAPLDRLLTSFETCGPPSQGKAAAEISNVVVGLLRHHAGRGPTKAKTVITSDLAAVTLGGCLTQIEQTVSGSGHGPLVAALRTALYETIRPDAEAAVASFTGRAVSASRIYQDGDRNGAVIAFQLEEPVGELGPASRSPGLNGGPVRRDRRRAG